jgi:hypothetical protein
MKKSLFVALFAAILMIAAPVMAHDNPGKGLGHGFDLGPGMGPGQGNGFGHQKGCDGPDCVAEGEFDISAFAGSFVMDGGIDRNFGAITGGGAIAGGFNMGGADADIDRSGDAYGYLRVGGGGFVKGHSYDFYDFDRNGLMYVSGSTASAEAGTNGYLNLAVDANGWRWGEVEADGGFFGVAGQATGTFSLMTLPGFLYDADGCTGGATAQGAVGYVEGDVDVESGWYNWFQEDNDTAAGSFYSWGSSDAHSWRGVEFNDGAKTEFMGTRTSSDTHVRTDYTDTGRDAHVDGGFLAGGVAFNATKMTAPNAMGKATAAGAYFGAGKLGCNYDGMANVKTNVSITQINGYKGSYVTSTAEATVSSQYSAGQPY